MPSVSAKQHNLMEAVAHDPKFAKKAGIKQSVGKDFVAADKKKKTAGQTVYADHPKRHQPTSRHGYGRQDR